MLLTCCCLDTSWYIWIRHIRYHQIVRIMLGLPRQMARYQLTMRKSRAIQRAHIVCLARTREYTYLIFEACILTWTSTQVSWWYDTLKDILRLRSDCICTHIYIYISINIWGFADPSWWCMFGLFEVETAKCGQQPVPQLQGKGPWKPRWHHRIRECLWVFTHLRKHIDPAKKWCSGGCCWYIYIVGLVVSWFQMFSMFHHIDLGDPNKLTLVFSGDGPIAAQAEPLNACGVSEPQSRCPIGDPWGIPKSCGWKLRGFRLDERGTPPW